MMILQRNVKFYKRQINARLKQLKNIQPFIAGSMVKIAHTCGNRNCKCTRGEKHENYYLTYKIKQKTMTKYIPVDLEKDVKKWTLEYKRIKKLLNEISQISFHILKQYGVEKKANKKIIKIKEIKNKNVREK